MEELYVSDITKQPFWDNLTLTAQKESLEIIRRKRKTRKIEKYYFIPSLFIIAIIVTSYVTLSNSENVNYFHYIFIFIIGIVPIYFACDVLNSALKDYNTFRKYLIRHINESFWISDSPECSYSRQYLEYMEIEEKIILFYE